MTRFVFFPGAPLFYIAALLLACWAFGIYGMVLLVAIFVLLALSNIP